MRIIFAGTPEFAVPSLAALVEAGHEVVLVLTQPDRPAGRGMKLKASPVKELALAKGLEVYQPESLKPAEALDRLRAVNADVMVVAAYGLIIPTPILDLPRRGCLNVHASLLPRWRGAAPIQRSMLAGDAVTGVTIMRVVPALDAGDMLMKGEIPITGSDTAQTLHDALAEMGARLMVSTLEQLDLLQAEPQDESLVTYAAKLQKSEAPLDWSLDAETLAMRVRAFNPFPVAQASFRGEPWRLWFAQAVSGRVGQPGEILSVSHGIDVACGTGVLRLLTLQRPGGKPLGWKELLAGHALNTGDRFDA